MDNMELNVNELTLIRIANKYGISDWRVIRKWNPHINPETNMIRTGEYLWIKK